MTSRRKLFIGSSQEAQTKGALGPLVTLLRRELPEIDIVPWNKSNWKNLKTALDSLSDSLIEYSYAVFLAFPDDPITIRGVEQYVARDNVIFEFGLFLSHLGPERTFLVAPATSSLAPDGKPFRILTDITGALRAGAYDIGPITGRKVHIDYKLKDVVKKIKVLESLYVSTKTNALAKVAQQNLESCVKQLSSKLDPIGKPESYYSGTLKTAVEPLILHRAMASRKSVQNAAKDLLLYFERVPDLCDARQLAEVQSHRNHIDAVWVFAEPMEFMKANIGDSDFEALRRCVLSNLQENVKYVYFVPAPFNPDTLDYIKGGQQVSKALWKHMMTNITVVVVDPRLFKTYFTIHFRSGLLHSVYMSSVMKNRKDLLIEVSDDIHKNRIYRCIRALGKNVSSGRGASVLDLVTVAH